MSQVKSCFNCKHSRIYEEHEMLYQTCSHSEEVHENPFGVCDCWEHEADNDGVANAYNAAVRGGV